MGWGVFLPPELLLRTAKLPKSCSPCSLQSDLRNLTNPTWHRAHFMHPKLTLFWDVQRSPSRFTVDPLIVSRHRARREPTVASDCQVRAGRLNSWHKFRCQIQQKSFFAIFALRKHLSSSNRHWNKGIRVTYVGGVSGVYVSGVGGILLSLLERQRSRGEPVLMVFKPGKTRLRYMYHPFCTNPATSALRWGGVGGIPDIVPILCTPNWRIFLRRPAQSP